MAESYEIKWAPKPYRLKDGPHTIFKGTMSDCLSRAAKISGARWADNGMRIVENNHGFRKEAQGDGSY